MAFYDSHKHFPSFGFGAKLNMFPDKARLGAPSPETSHCFALNGNIFDPECVGIEGIKEAYKKSLSDDNLSFHGPTNFAPVITMVNDLAEALEVSQ